MAVRWRPGAGTTFLLRVPLSLAITRGVHFQVGGVDLALPLAAVRTVTEVVEELAAAEGVVVEGEAVPYRHLAAWLGTEPAPAAVRPAVVARVGERLLALGVDRLCGQEEMVLKPLSPYLAAYPWASAASVGPDGDVRLLLDLAALEREPRA
ncbi:MAG: hypothetical protein D6739_01200 [Nitrospirae bacterium]|nr:MAG: hypothetical protein D6739_01200 [Nitrospirota bacterium]